MTDRHILTRRTVLGSAALGAAAAGLAACSPPEGTPGADSGSGASDAGGDGKSAKDTINLFMYQKPNGIFCPIAPSSGPDNQVMSLLFEPLLIADAEGKLVPRIAEKEPEVSEDATTFTFTIRKDLKWSDGQPLTARDLVYTYTRAADAKSNPGAGMYGALQGAAEYNGGTATEISGLTAPDDTTFVIATTGPNAGLLGQIATLLVMPEHATKDLAAETFASDPYWSAPTAASGPYQFGEFKTDQYVKLTKNPEYREPAKIDNVFLKMVTADVATSQLGTGELDVAAISANDAESVEALDTVTITDVPTNGFVRACWNQTQERFKDVKVRQAFLCAVDREGIVKSALAGKGKVRNSAFDPAQTPDGIDEYAFDPERAKKLLGEANWDGSQSVKLAWIAGGNPDRDAAATVIQSQLKDVGVTVELQQVEGSFFTPAYKDRTYDITIYGGGDYKSEPFSTYNILATDRWNPQGGNNGYYSNPEVDAALKAANEAPDADDRQKQYEAAAKLENADPSQMWLYTPDTVWAVAKNLQGFTGLSIDKGFIDAQKWTFTA
ncbi:ABC transporter substrate-binding protein [Brachybacterium huguangmaarense]